MKVLAPLYAKLSGRYRVTVLALTSAGAYMRNQGIPSIGFRDFDFTNSAKIQSYGQALAADIPHNDLVSREETVAYLGASFFDLVDQLGDEVSAYECYRHRGRAAFLPVASLKRIIAKLRADLVITTNAPRAERAALVAAREAGLLTLCVNDNLWVDSGAVDIANQDLADRICVLNSAVKDQIVSKTGVSHEVVKVTGTPVFDSVKKTAWVPGDSSIPRVLLADCDIPNTLSGYKNLIPDVDQLTRIELNRLAEKGLIDVFFRPHPHQLYNYTDFRASKISPKNESLHQRLANTDVVVTAISTVGVEGKAMGLGLVSLEKTVYTTVQSYARIGLSTGIVKPQCLESAIFREMGGVGSSEPLYEGDAAANIFHVIESLFVDA